MTGAEQIAAERQRQIDEEHYLPASDVIFNPSGQLAIAASMYAIVAHTAVIRPDAARYHRLPPDPSWPWEEKYWNPSNDPIRNLVKAGALIAAEIDRLQDGEA